MVMLWWHSGSRALEVTEEPGMVSEEKVRSEEKIGEYFGTASVPRFPTGDRTERKRNPQGSSCAKIFLFYINFNQKHIWMSLNVF